MSMKNNGGQAFPSGDAVELADGSRFGGYPGMTIRDYFAGQALAGLMDSFTRDIEAGRPTSKLAADIPGFAGLSYAFADAMIAERDK